MQGGINSTSNVFFYARAQPAKIISSRTAASMSASPISDTQISPIDQSRSIWEFACDKKVV